MSLLKLLFVFLLPFASHGLIDTVPELDVKAYLGRWYQVYSNKLVASTIERGGVCVRADYGQFLGSERFISVLNAQNQETPEGKLSTIRGIAVQPRPEQHPGRLLVAFPGTPPGTYWIIKLGPQKFGRDGQYEYSVVTDAVGASLFVLARDVGEFKEKYEKEVLDFVGRNGFEGEWKGAIETKQEGCTYDLPDDDESVVDEAAFSMNA